MGFDVFLTYAPEDSDMASLITRRLKALRFKVRFNKKGEQSVFDEKHTRDVINSATMLVIWSEHALTSDWVRAAASIGHASDMGLFHSVVDNALPYEPFHQTKPFDLKRFTSRRTVQDWYGTVEALGEHIDRTDLRTWMEIPKTDEDAKTDWLQAHPEAPLAIHAITQRDTQLGIAIAASKGNKATKVASASAIGKPKRAAPIALRSEQANLATETEKAVQKWLVPAVSIGALGLFIAGWAFRSKPLIAPPPAAGILCPVGEIPVCRAPADLSTSDPSGDNTEGL